MADSQSIARFLNPWTLHLQKLGLELKCPLCLKLLNKPILLPCNHLFCNLCVPDSTQCGSECPVCKHQFADRDIRPAPYIENMVSIYQSLDAAFVANVSLSLSSGKHILLLLLKWLFLQGKHILKVLKLLEIGEGEKFEVLSSTGFATRELRKDSLEFTGVKENLELKQFACDFLSLFCSEVPPGESLRFQQKVHLNKRLIACKWMVFWRIGIWFIVPLQGVMRGLSK